MTAIHENQPPVEFSEITDSQSLNEVFAIRRVVFVEEQQVDPAEEYDEYESSSRHFLLRVGGQGVATGRFRSTDKGWKVERMAVLAEARGKGYGEQVLRGMLALIPQDGRPIYLHAQEHALAFYRKNDFLPQGERFWEANIPHFKCVWKPA
jgi:predicted GNAT family N-acyltransferase